MHEIEGIIEKVGNDIRPWLGQLPTASTRKQVRLLEFISVTAEYAAKEIGEKLKFQRTLNVFNRHGALADPPFGAIPINGRVLLANYTDLNGMTMNGVVVDEKAFTREVAYRWGLKGDKND